LQYLEKVISLLLSITIILMSFSGCITAKRNGFAIYLAKEKANYEVTDTQMESLTLEDSPFITTDDIVAYDWSTHRVELTWAATEKLRKLEVPVMGRLFVVCIGERRIYAGAFMTPISSIMFRGVSIYTWLESAQNRVAIVWGYPDGGASQPTDPRSNPEIFDALSRAGKVK
jgi:hypothetical protein